jgi:hypothetical protein
MLKNHFNIIYSDDLQNGILRIALCAPTGVAASNIQGYTVHGLFKMDFYQGGEAMYNDLDGLKLDQLKHHFRKRPTIIIMDEVSMNSNVMLMKLHARLCNITGLYTKSNSTV